MKLSRRRVTAQIVKLLAVSPFAIFSLQALAKKKKIKMIDPNSKSAKKLMYTTDKKSVEKDIKKKAFQEKGITFPMQMCKNCANFSESSRKHNGKGVGKCSKLSSKKYVYVDAWCNSWERKT